MVTISFECGHDVSYSGVREANKAIKAHPDYDLARKVLRAGKTGKYNLSHLCAGCFRTREAEKQAAREDARLDIKIVRHVIPMFGTESPEEAERRRQQNALMPVRFVSTGKTHLAETKSG